MQMVSIMNIGDFVYLTIADHYTNYSNIGNIIDMYLNTVHVVYPTYGSVCTYFKDELTIVHPKYKAAQSVVLYDGTVCTLDFPSVYSIRSNSIWYRTLTGVNCDERNFLCRWCK